MIFYSGNVWQPHCVQAEPTETTIADSSDGEGGFSSVATTNANCHCDRDGQAMLSFVLR